MLRLKLNHVSKWVHRRHVIQREKKLVNPKHQSTRSTIDEAISPPKLVNGYFHCNIMIDIKCYPIYQYHAWSLPRVQETFVMPFPCTYTIFHIHACDLCAVVFRYGYIFLHYWIHVIRADSWSVPSQWETALLGNDVSHWLGASLESVLVKFYPWNLGLLHWHQGAIMRMPQIQWNSPEWYGLNWPCGEYLPTMFVCVYPPVTKPKIISRHNADLAMHSNVTSRIISCNYSSLSKLLLRGCHSNNRRQASIRVWYAKNSQ